MNLVTLEILGLGLIVFGVISYSTFKNLKKEKAKVSEIRKLFEEMHHLCCIKMGASLYNLISEIAATQSNRKFMTAVIDLTENQEFLRVMQQNTNYAEANEKFVHLDELVRSHIMVRKVPR